MSTVLHGQADQAGSGLRHLGYRDTAGQERALYLVQAGHVCRVEHMWQTSLAEGPGMHGQGRADGLAWMHGRTEMWGRPLLDAVEIAGLRRRVSCRWSEGTQKRVRPRGKAFNGMCSDQV